MVMVLERMAAVVTVPQKKDFQAFLKKNLLNLSGELASSKPEINFLNSKMEVKSSTNANKAIKNPLGTIVNNESVTGPNRDQRVAKELSMGAADGVKK